MASELTQGFICDILLVPSWVISQYFGIVKGLVHVSSWFFNVIFKKDVVERRENLGRLQIDKSQGDQPPLRCQTVNCQVNGHLFV